MWVELGKPEEMVADIVGCTETPSKLKPVSDSQKDYEDVSTSTPSNTADAPLSESPSLSVSDTCRECESMGPKSLRRFLLEKDGPISALEIDCLKLHVGCNSILKSVPIHFGPDIDVFLAKNIIAGPLEVHPLINGRWNVPSYEKTKKLYTRCCKIDRDALYTKFQMFLK